MTILAQASNGGTWIFLTLGIAIGLVALAAWVTHWIWFFRLFRLFRSFGKDNVVHSIMRTRFVPAVILPEAREPEDAEC
jgi:hypothetical protein